MFKLSFLKNVCFLFVIVEWWSFLGKCGIVIKYCKNDFVYSVLKIMSKLVGNIVLDFGVLF